MAVNQAAMRRRARSRHLTIVQRSWLRHARFRVRPPTGEITSSRVQLGSGWEGG